MEEKKKNTSLYLAIAFLCIVVIGSGCYIIMNKDKDTKDNNPVETSNVNSNKEETISQKITKFLTSKALITTSDVVGEHEPAGFVFLEDGKFAYYNEYFDHHFVESEENRVISYIGTWTVEDKTLKLKITEEEKAVGGTISNEPPTYALTGYKKQVNKVDRTDSYTISGVETPDDELANMVLTINGKTIKWYSLTGIEEEYLNKAKNIASSGYSN